MTNSEQDFAVKIQDSSVDILAISRNIFVKARLLLHTLQINHCHHCHCDQPPLCGRAYTFSNALSRNQIQLHAKCLASARTPQYLGMTNNVDSFAAVPSHHSLHISFV